MEKFTIKQIEEIVKKALKEAEENPSIQSTFVDNEGCIYPTEYYPKTGMILMDYPINYFPIKK